MTITSAFLIAWPAFAVAAYFLFVRSRNAAFKRKYFAPFVILSLAVFYSYIVATAPRLWTTLVFLPFVALIAFQNIRAIKFCDSCGCTYNTGWSGGAERCPGCGAEVKNGK